jgi:tetratricopeptide (TPR) repeat protein
MLTLLVAIALSAATFLAVFFGFGLVGAILPTVVVFLVAFFLISRRIARRMEMAMMQAQGEFQKGRIERGMVMLEDLKKQYGKWQFFATSALDGQIGSIHYMRQDFVRAKPYLERSFAKHWIAKGMLAVMAFKKRDYAQMDKLFESATRYSSKQGLLWSLWAYCHWKLGELDKAIEILNNGQKKLGESDPHLNANLNSLKNSKKMKMRSYGEQWYQFHLEVPPQMKEMQGQRVKFARR